MTLQKGRKAGKLKKENSKQKINKKSNEEVVSDLVCVSTKRYADERSENIIEFDSGENRFCRIFGKIIP